MSGTDGSRRRTLLTWALVWALTTVANTLILVQQGRTTAGRALFSSAVDFAIAAVLGMVVWRLVPRFPPPASRPIAFAAAHIAAALVNTVLWFALRLIFLYAVAGGAIARVVARESGGWSLLYGVFLYGCVAAASHAARASRALREQQLAAARAEAVAARARLVAVRAQLNPHFLFNALHSLAGMVRRDPAAAEAAIERLGALLRYALDEGAGEAVALADEWAFVRDYLALEGIRLGERLRLDARLDDDALDCRVPPFLLQPLVENAVRHGIGPRPGGGRLVVTARQDGDDLRLSVADDGPGADPDAAARTAGLGLRSVRHLVESRVAGRSAMTITTSPGAGFRVDLTLPAEVPAGRPRPGAG